MTLYNNANEILFVLDTLFSMLVRINLTHQISSKSDWLKIFWFLKMRFFSHSSFSSFSFSSSFTSLRIHFLVAISMLIKKFLRFSSSFFVSKSVLSVMSCNFFFFIKIDRSFVKCWHCSNKCSKVWVNLQFSMLFFVSKFDNSIKYDLK